MRLRGGNFFWVFLLGLSFLGAQGVTFEALNKAMEVPLFEDDNLWDDDERAVAKRLKWPEESRTDTLASYRLYADAKVSVLGTRPYSLALYAERGVVQQLSLIFSNKGDVEEGKPNDSARTGERRGEVDPKVIRALDAAIKKDAETISQRLRELLGEPKSETFGLRNQREQTLRWDWNGHAFLLAAPGKEYASIRILPSDAADRDGKVERIPREELKAMLLARVEKRENGDRVVQQIPMVDQGPKGYCVPATVERHLRYLGIPCDLYLLAMKGGTMIGGGTSSAQMISSIDPLCSLYGRSIQMPKPEIQAKVLSKSIDQGLPLLWCCFVDRLHDRMISERSKERKSVTDWSAWKEKLNDFRRPEALPKKVMTAAHMRMIIGYNAETGEVAISDSWGEAFQERWMTFEEATAISQDELFVIQ